MPTTIVTEENNDDKGEETIATVIALKADEKAEAVEEQTEEAISELEESIEAIEDAAALDRQFTNEEINALWQRNQTMEAELLELRQQVKSLTPPPTPEPTPEPELIPNPSAVEVSQAEMITPATSMETSSVTPMEAPPESAVVSPEAVPESQPEKHRRKVILI